ncbi:MAG TPA: BON domain-containing protein [Vicinamibacterales bacterium]|nr:BON domain-containing protein [Vicinamibacterales bacterium]
MKMTYALTLLAVLTIVPAAVSAAGAAAPQSAGERIKEGGTTTKHAVVKGAKAVGRKTTDGVSKSGEVMTDAWITTRVNASMVNEDALKGSHINVDTSAHVVTLKGTVLTVAGRARAGVVARHTEGVRRVVNNLHVEPKR